MQKERERGAERGLRRLRAVKGRLAPLGFQEHKRLVAQAWRYSAKRGTLGVTGYIHSRKQDGPGGPPQTKGGTFPWQTIPRANLVRA